MPAYFPQFVNRIGRIGADPADSPDLRQRKRLLVVLSILVMPAGIIWGLLYFAFSEWLAGAIPLGYAVLSAFSLNSFSSHRRYRVLKFIQILLILLLPFLLQIALGGFIDSSAVILWSMLGVFFVLIIESPRSALPWFLVYTALVGVSGLVEPYLRQGNNIPAGVVILFFVLNISTTSLIAFAMLYYFMSQLRQE